MFTGTRLCLTLNIRAASLVDADCTTSVVWRGLAVLDRTLVWFCTPLSALAPESALAFSDPMHCKSARLDDSRLDGAELKTCKVIVLHYKVSSCVAALRPLLFDWP